MLFMYFSIVQLVCISSIALYKLGVNTHSVVAISNRRSFSSLRAFSVSMHYGIFPEPRGLITIMSSEPAKVVSSEPALERLSAVEIYGLNSFEFGDTSNFEVNQLPNNFIGICQNHFNYIRVVRPSSCLILLRILVSKVKRFVSLILKVK